MARLTDTVVFPDPPLSDITVMVFNTRPVFYGDKYDLLRVSASTFEQTLPDRCEPDGPWPGSCEPANGSRMTEPPQPPS